MPRIIDSTSRADSLALCVNHLIASDGVGALTLRRIAQISRVSPAAMLKQFGSRAMVLRVACKRTSDDLITDFVEKQPHAGLPALLPTPTTRSWSDDPTVQARVWTAWLELARNDQGLQRCVEDHHDKLLACIDVLTRGSLTRDQHRLVLATSTGLQLMMSDPSHPVAPAVAREMLAEVVRGLGVPPVPVAPGTCLPEELRVPLNWMRGALHSTRGRPDPEIARALTFNDWPAGEASGSRADG